MRALNFLILLLELLSKLLSLSTHPFQFLACAEQLLFVFDIEEFQHLQLLFVDLQLFDVLC